MSSVELFVRLVLVLLKNAFDRASRLSTPIRYQTHPPGIQDIARRMSEEIDRHVLRRFEICQKLGKGVSPLADKQRRELAISFDGRSIQTRQNNYARATQDHKAL